MMVTPYKVVKWSTEKRYFCYMGSADEFRLKSEKKPLIFMISKQLPTSQGNQPQEENHYVDAVECVANGITYCN